MARPLPRTSSNLWWNRAMPYRIFLLRELSAVFLAIYMILLLILVRQVRAGDDSFADYLEVLQNPLLIAFHVVALPFALLHTVSWFRAVPKAMVVKVGERRVPGVQLIAGVYAIWAAASAVVLVVFLVA
jgi:fumarate reductase subunit C